MSKRLTVAIVTRNRPTNLALLLESLRQQTYTDWDLFIIDDASDNHRPDDTFIINRIVDEIKFAGHAVRIFRMDKNIGVCGCRNAVYDKIETELVFDANDDHVWERDMLENLVNVFDDENVGAACSCTPFIGLQIYNFIDRNGVRPKRYKLPTERAKEFNTAYVKDNSICMTRDVDFIYLDEHAQVESTPIEITHGSQFMMRKELFSKSPEGYSPLAFTEESDLSLRIKEKGYKVMFVPNAMNWHFQTPHSGTRGHSKEQLVKWQQEDYRLFNSNWYSKIEGWNK